MTTRADRYDAVIVGARCAGAATGLLLARAGLRVKIVDRARYGSDTLSTHALMRGAVLQLERLGVLDRVVAAGTPAVRRTTFIYGDERLPIDLDRPLYAPRRTVLDRVLADAAREAGADVEFGCRLSGLVRDADGRVRGAEVRSGTGAARRLEADVVIGADGVRSSVAELVGAPVELAGASESAVIYAYLEGVADEGFRWHFAPGLGSGAIPTNDGASNVFVAMPAARFHAERGGDTAALFDRLLTESAPDLAAEARSARPVGGYRGFAGASGFLRRPAGPGWALVGDASWFRDPITAHGITDALRDAEFLARAVVRGDAAAFEEYRAARDGFAEPMMTLSDRVARYDWTLAEVQAMHLDLSRQMKREVETILGFGALSPAPRCVRVPA